MPPIRSRPGYRPLPLSPWTLQSPRATTPRVGPKALPILTDRRPCRLGVNNSNHSCPIFSVRISRKNKGAVMSLDHCPPRYRVSEKKKLPLDGLALCRPRAATFAETSEPPARDAELSKSIPCYSAAVLTRTARVESPVTTAEIVLTLGLEGIKWRAFKIDSPSCSGRTGRSASVTLAWR